MVTRNTSTVQYTGLVKDMIRLFYVLVTVIVLPKILSFFSAFLAGSDRGRERTTKGGRKGGGGGGGEGVSFALYRSLLL